MDIPLEYSTLIYGFTLRRFPYQTNDAWLEGFVAPQSSFQIHDSTPAEDQTLQLSMPDEAEELKR